MEKSSIELFMECDDT
ncbi:hypothetical protein R5R35_003936 [Gryllus longicercus]|uniref:Uncharacterized protein n=1 Tax=Gryllus longicercus TaxID=2509291 RepID=A0AAN9VHY0_9ORTH